MRVYGYIVLCSDFEQMDCIMVAIYRLVLGVVFIVHRIVIVGKHNYAMQFVNRIVADLRHVRLAAKLKATGNAQE